MVIIYYLIVFLFSLYSYVLIDPNITFFQAQWWAAFRELAVTIGYYNRNLSWIIYMVLIILLFIFYIYFYTKRKINPLTLAIGVALITVFSYPFLSHDFFNYMFDAKIFTYYHQNPYTMRALDFPSDSWLRFMQWTHRTYPYGPSFLILSFIPSAISLGKFIIDYFLFKLMFATFYVLSVYCLQKINKSWALLFALNPLIIVEGLVSSHNDLIAVSLSLVGIYFIFKDKKIISRLVLVLSGGIKYISLPFILITKDNKYLNMSALAFLLILLGYLSFKSEIQPWYFLNLFILIPYYEKVIFRLNIFFAGLLFSYYPYIALGGWDKPEKVLLKHQIIIVFTILNILYLGFIYLKESRKTFLSK